MPYCKDRCSHVLHSCPIDLDIENDPYSEKYLYADFSCVPQALNTIVVFVYSRGLVSPLISKFIIMNAMIQRRINQDLLKR